MQKKNSIHLSFNMDQLRSEAKFDKMSTFGRTLPKIRENYFEDLAKGNDKQNDLPYERVMALIVRIIRYNLYPNR